MTGFLIWWWKPPPSVRPRAAGFGESRVRSDEARLAVDRGGLSRDRPRLSNDRGFLPDSDRLGMGRPFPRPTPLGRRDLRSDGEPAHVSRCPAAAASRPSGRVPGESNVLIRQLRPEDAEMFHALRLEGLRDFLLIRLEL